MIDIRTALQFDEAHIPGAISNTVLQSGFGTRLAWIAGPDTPVVLVGRDDDDALRAVELAAAVGVGRIAGYLAGGMTSWREERLPTQSIARLTVPELHERAGELQILDVRERDEWEAGHIPGSIFAPYHDIRAIPDELDATRPIAVDLRLRPARRGRREPDPALRRPRGLPRGRRRRAGMDPRRLAGRALASTHGRPTPSRPSRRLGYDPAQRLRRGRALPPDVHDPAAVVGRDDAARARAVARGDELEPALAGARHGGARPGRVPVLAAAAAGLDLAGAR